MPTPKKGPRIGRDPAHQRLIMANMASSLFEAGYLVTTVAKAKALRPYAEHLITKAKTGGVHQRRQVIATIHDQAQNPLAAAVNAYVMQDEARHVAFGRLTLRDYYPQLTQKERDEREEFLLEACYLMRDRFDAVEVWKTLGLDPARCAEHMYDSGFMEMFRSSLFTRIVPIVKDIGLWGPVITKGYEDMGIIGYAQSDVQALQDADDTIAKDFDARRNYVQSVVDRARTLETA